MTDAPLPAAIPTPGRNVLEFFDPYLRHGRTLDAVFPALPLGPFREGAVVLGGDFTSSFLPLELLEEIELFVPAPLEAVPDEIEVIQSPDLVTEQLAFPEVVPLAFDPPAQLRVRVAAQDVGMSVLDVEGHEFHKVKVPDCFVDARTMATLRPGGLCFIFLLDHYFVFGVVVELVVELVVREKGVGFLFQALGS